LGVLKLMYKVGFYIAVPISKPF